MRSEFVADLEKEEQNNTPPKETPPRKRSWTKENYFTLILIILIVVLIFILIRPFFINLVGEDAPDFSITTIDGEKFKLSDNFGKVIVLDMMTTSCSACKSEMEHLRRIYERYSPEDVIMVSVSVDSGDSNSELREYQSEYGDNWTFARDTDGVSNKYNIRYTPTTVIIDRDGIIRYYHEGVSSFQTLSKEIDKVL
jgi:peroxiredoxin